MPEPYYEHTEYPELNALCLARRRQGYRELFCALPAHSQSHRHLAHLSAANPNEIFTWHD
jgi:hypothetical protein